MTTYSATRDSGIREGRETEEPGGTSEFIHNAKKGQCAHETEGLSVVHQLQESLQVSAREMPLRVQRFTSSKVTS
jgi:hexokinase